MRAPGRSRPLAHALVLMGLAVTTVASSLALSNGPLAAVGPTSAQVAAADRATALEQAAALEQARADQTRAAVSQAAQLALDQASTAREQASAAAVGADRLAALDAATGALRSLLVDLQPEGTAGVRGGEPTAGADGTDVADAAAVADTPAAAGTGTPGDSGGGVGQEGSGDSRAGVAGASPVGTSPAGPSPAGTGTAEAGAGAAGTGDAGSTVAGTQSASGTATSATGSEAATSGGSPSPTSSSYAVTSPLTLPDPVADQAGILDVATTAVDEVRAALPTTLDVDVDEQTAAVLTAVQQLAQAVAEVSGEVEVSRATAALAQSEEELARQQAEAVEAAARSRAARLAKDAHSLDAYENGQVPVSALCSPAFDLTVHLRCDAAELLDSLNRAYEAEFGTDLQVTDSYRSLGAQVVCQQEKGSLCADPGTSNHGMGVAVDLGGAVRWSGTDEHAWMLEHSEEYGWVKPDWSLDTGSKPEPWHFDFAGAPG